MKRIPSSPRCDRRARNRRSGVDCRRASGFGWTLARAWIWPFILFLVSSPVHLVGAASAAETDDNAYQRGVVGPVVEQITWTGFVAFAEDELEDRILTAAQPWLELRFWKPKRRLDEFTLEEDTNRIVDAYHELGYFSATAEARVVETAPDRATIEFVIDEGKQVRLGTWQLEILQHPDDPDPPTTAELEELRSATAVASGEPFGSKLYRDRREKLFETCGALGFTTAHITGGANVDPDAGLADVDWRLDLGPRMAFGKIEVRGLERIDEEIVRREFTIQEGDRFIPKTIADTERRLVATGLFRSVAIGRPQSRSETIEPTDSASDANRIDLEVRVDEAPPRSFRASVGYGTEDGPRGEVSLGWRNFTGQGRQLNLRVFGSLLDAGLEASLGQPYVWGELARGDLAVSALRQDRPGYEAFVTGATGLLTFYPDRDGPWSVTIGPGLEVAQILEFGIDVSERLRGPRQSLIVNWFTVARYQEVDDPIDPRSGLAVELRNEIGGFPVGSDLDYHRWHLGARLYQPMGPLVWAFRADATTLDPIGEGVSAVPLTRRLYSGGTNSIRGFGFQKLGPEDIGNDPIGGLSRMELSVELRIPVWGRFGLVGFVDAGDVQSDAFAWKPSDLRASAGPGLRVATPVGPLRFDFGWLLNAAPGADPWRFHLSVGHAF